MTAERLDIERRILARYFPSFRHQASPAPGFIGVLKSNEGTAYTLWVPTGSGFPDRPPKIYVLSPTLKTRKGHLLSEKGASGSYHTLTPDEHGHTQICHHSPAVWHPKLTVYHALLKARVWLEAFEAHRRTGDPIDRWLDHM